MNHFGEAKYEVETMSSNESDDNQLDLYLDGEMPQQDVADFLETVDDDSLQQAQNAQQRIDDSLRRMMSFEKLDHEDIVQQFLRKSLVGVNARDQAASSTKLSRRSWAQIAVAAAVLLLASLGVWFYSGSGAIEPVFNARTLASIYAEKVDSGFRPYYYCEDDARFAEVFATKLGQALALAEMPSGREMVGISYLGGISRSTVAMLCVVDEQKVLVFVDRAGESGFETATADSDDDLNVFVEEKNGLVFCEVTPLDSAQMIEHFRFMD